MADEGHSSIQMSSYSKLCVTVDRSKMDLKYFMAKVLGLFFWLPLPVACPCTARLWCLPPASWFHSVFSWLYEASWFISWDLSSGLLWHFRILLTVGWNFVAVWCFYVNSSWHLVWSAKANWPTAWICDRTSMISKAKIVINPSADVIWCSRSNLIISPAIS